MSEISELPELPELSANANLSREITRIKSILDEDLKPALSAWIANTLSAMGQCIDMLADTIIKLRGPIADIIKLRLEMSDLFEEYRRKCLHIYTHTKKWRIRKKYAKLLGIEFDVRRSR